MADDPASVQAAVALYLSGGPSTATTEVIVKLLRNIANDPGAERFRRVRMSNPKIRDTVGAALGAADLLAAVCFRFCEQAGPDGGPSEEWAIMDPPSTASVKQLEEAVALLERPLSTTTTGMPQDVDELADAVAELPAKPVDRQVRVFVPAPDQGLAARIQVPQSFYERSGAELRAELVRQRRAIESSQLLITQATREKQAAALKRRYRYTIVRVQLPDNSVLQGVFRPSEKTNALYEFVSDALFDPALEFQLVHPHPAKQSIILSGGGTKEPPSLEDVGLVPAALVILRACGDLPYAGLRKDLILLAQPLTSVPFPESSDL
eukprot:SM000138S00030  [mRNA]  locus=s138:185795:187812:+ [translate_table: standard]